MPKPLLVITPPPTPNGRLHLGHVGGPFLRADVLVRLRRLIGESESTHLSHIDLYQSYVQKRAAEIQSDALEFRAEMARGILADFAAYSIRHDLMVDNASAAYLDFLDRALEYAIPRFQQSARPACRCGGCGGLLYEAFVKGFCANCLHHCYANVCENCGLPQALEAMIDPVCGRCGEASAEPAEEDQYVIEFSQRDVDATLAAVRPLCAANRRLASMCDVLGAHSVPLSYPADYGVFPAPLNGAMNPWVEIYFAHLYGVMTLSGIDTSEPFAQLLDQLASAPSREVVYFFGVDNAYWYAFLFPHLCRTLEIDALWPTALHANFFMELNGAKMSSSRNNVRWARELEGEASVPHLRTQLAASSPEFAPREFTPQAPLRATAIGASQTAGAGFVGEGHADLPATLWARMSATADPSGFSLERVLNVLQEGAVHEARLRTAGHGHEAGTVSDVLDAICDGLSLA